MVRAVFSLQWLEDAENGVRPNDSPAITIWPNKQALTGSLLIKEDRKTVMNALAAYALDWRLNAPSE